MAAQTQASPICEMNVGLINALYSKCRRDSVGRVLLGRGAGAQQKLVSAQRYEFLDDWLIRELEFQTPDDVRLSVATTARAGSTLLNLGSCFVEIALPPEFRKVHGRQEWHVPADLHAAALQRLDAFSVPPAIVIDSAWALTALWPLTTPLKLDLPVEAERATRLQHGLASALRGRIDDVKTEQPTNGGHAGQVTYSTSPAWAPGHHVVRLPGTRNHDRGAFGATVTFLRFSERRVEPSALEAALLAAMAPTLAPAATPIKSTTRKARV